MNKFKLFKTITILLFCVACDAAQNNLVLSKENPVDEKIQLETITALQLPENIEIKYFYETKESDELIKSIILMNKESFINWISNYSLKLDNFDSEKRYLLGQDSDEWNPASSLMLEVTQVNFENGKILNIGYTNREKEYVVVYLVFHGK